MSSPTPATCVLDLLGDLESQWETYCALTLKETAALKRWEREEVSALTEEKRAVMHSLQRGIAPRRQALVALWVASGLPIATMPSEMVACLEAWCDWARRQKESEDQASTLCQHMLAIDRQACRLHALKMTLEGLQHALDAQLHHSLGWVQTCLDSMTAPEPDSGLYTRYGKGRVATPSILQKRA